MCKFQGQAFQFVVKTQLTQCICAVRGIIIGPVVQLKPGEQFMNRLMTIVTAVFMSSS